MFYHKNEAYIVFLASKIFQCFSYCASREARLPLYEEKHLVEKFKLQNQELILNMTAQTEHKMTISDCGSDNSNSTFPNHVRFAPFLKRIFFFVGVRSGF